MSKKVNLNEGYITNKYHGNPLSIVRDDSCVSYGPKKYCKRCKKKMNYLNAKSSRYCHTCKSKVVIEEDFGSTSQNSKNPINEISGKWRGHEKS